MFLGVLELGFYEDVLIMSRENTVGSEFANNRTYQSSTPLVTFYSAMNW